MRGFHCFSFRFLKNFQGCINWFIEMLLHTCVSFPIPNPTSLSPCWTECHTPCICLKISQAKPNLITGSFPPTVSASKKNLPPNNYPKTTPQPPPTPPKNHRAQHVFSDIFFVVSCKHHTFLTPHAPLSAKCRRLSGSPRLWRFPPVGCFPVEPNKSRSF